MEDLNINEITELVADKKYEEAKEKLSCISNNDEKNHSIFQ